MFKDLSNWIDRNKNLIINILLDLLSFDTTNPPGDTTEIVEYIREYFDSLGFKYMEVVAHKNKPNLIIHNDLEGPALFLYNGHMDVVPVSSTDIWICDPFKGCISNGFIYGRGTADMKGSLASLMVGIKSLVENNIDIDRRIELHFVADEEVGGIYGTKYLVEKGYVKARYGLVGESSVMNNKVYIRPAVRGGVWIKLKSFGKAGHASNPKSGVNAVLNMARVLTYLNTLSIDEFNDVDTTTTTPADGDKMVWDSVTNNWVVNKTINNYLELYQDSITTSITTSGAFISWDGLTNVGSNFSFTSGDYEITIDVAGIYLISYNLTLKVNNNTRTSSRAEIQLNGNTVNGSVSAGYHRNKTNGEGTISKSVIIPLSVNDVIRIYSEVTAGASLSTLDNGCSLSIIKL